MTCVDMWGWFNSMKPSRLRLVKFIATCLSVLCLVLLIHKNEEAEIVHGAQSNRLEKYFPLLPDLEQTAIAFQTQKRDIRLDQNTMAQKLFESVRVLCWVMTFPENLKMRGKPLKATWGRRCNRLIFIGTMEDKDLGAIALNITEDRNHLWQKTKESFKYIHARYLNETDWILKADDDSFVVMENLRYMLSAYDPNDPIWFGHRFKKYSKQGYMSGGASYVLSREAVRRFVEEALPDPKKCKAGDTGAEDAELGKCLDKVNVTAMDSRDSSERERFHPFVPVMHLEPRENATPNWYKNYTYYSVKNGLECCSESTISFHYINPLKMYEMEYFLYHVRPFGILPFRFQVPPTLPPDTNGTQTRETNFLNKTKSSAIPSHDPDLGNNRSGDVAKPKTTPTALTQNKTCPGK